MKGENAKASTVTNQNPSLTHLTNQSPDRIEALFLSSGEEGVDSLDRVKFHITALSLKSSSCKKLLVGENDLILDTLIERVLHKF